MTVELQDLFMQRMKKVVVGDNLFTIWVSPDKFTKHVVFRIQELTKGTDPFAIAEEIIVPLVAKWDLTVNGEPYEITRENVADLGLDLEFEIIDAIDAAIDFSGKVLGRSRRGSDDGSSTTSSLPPPSPIGTSQ